MVHMHTYIKKEHKEVLSEIIKELPEGVFGAWHVTPVFTIEDTDEDDEDFRFCIEYDDPTDNSVMHRHNAMDLALAYVAGYFSAKGIKW